jgi:lipid-A-disaccharide synthase
VIFFVSPQLWAWKKHRIKLVQKYVRKMLVIFPFEEAFYRERGVEAEFVGHPLAELPLPSISREEFAAENGLDPEKTWIGLLPGSRPKEIRDNLPEMLKAARGLADPRPAGAKAQDVSGGHSARLKSCPDTEPSRLAPNANLGSCFPRSENPDLGHPASKFSSPEARQFIVPLAATLNAAQRDEARRLVEIHGGGLDVRLVEDARAALFHARASVVASGTATVEAALMGNPFVVVYRVSPLTYAIAKRVVTVPHVAMANLIAGKRVAPELIQHDFTAPNIVQQIERLLPDGVPRESMMEELARIRGLLNTLPGHEGGSGGAIERVASVTLAELGAASPARIPAAVN